MSEIEQRDGGGEEETEGERSDMSPHSESRTTALLPKIELDSSAYFYVYRCTWRSDWYVQQQREIARWYCAQVANTKQILKTNQEKSPLASVPQWRYPDQHKH